MTVAEIDELAAALEVDGGILECWRAELDASRAFANASPPALPDGVAIERDAERFGFDTGVTAALLDSRDICHDAAALRLARHAQWRILERYDPNDLLPAWPELARSDDQGVRLLWAYVALSLVDACESLHRAWGVPEDVSVATLADIGRQTSFHHEVYGRWGNAELSFLAHHLSGHLFQLGRLQFQMRPWFLGSHDELDNGDPVLDVHVPETGPLVPEDCDESFRRASAFFARHVAAHQARHVMCISWLLDPQLREHLPPSSNIVRFQSRFEPLDLRLPVRSAIFKFVFHDADVELEDRTIDVAALARLSPSSRLEHAVVDHVSAGGEWWMTAGYGWLGA